MAKKKTGTVKTYNVLFGKQEYSVTSVSPCDCNGTIDSSGDVYFDDNNDIYRGSTGVFATLDELDKAMPTEIQKVDDNHIALAHDGVKLTGQIDLPIASINGESILMNKNIQVLAPVMIEITNVPPTATTGTLTSNQVNILNTNEHAYVMFNHEKYYLMDKGHTEGYLTYTHVGFENNNNNIKCITINLNNYSWILNIINVMDILTPLSSTPTLYGHQAGDVNPELFRLSTSASTWSIPYRNANGKTQFATPSENDHGNTASNKEYVDKSHLKKITHRELMVLRDQGKLIPGRQYRIIDYICTTTQSETRSANHQFDIIVTADNENTLNENARACLHEGDTYFANCKLESWELKYSLDNDNSRFAWADPVNGKGVIYFMKDEFNNECPYDFKNIRFKRYACTLKDEYLDLAFADLDTNPYYATQSYTPKVFNIDNDDSIWVYTFHKINENLDATIFVEGELTVHDNKIKPYQVNSIIDDANNVSIVLELNNIIFYTEGYVYAKDEQIKNNIFENDCHTMTFYKKCYNNFFNNKCYDNIFGNNCNDNKFGNNYYNNILIYNCSRNIFDDNCNGNILNNSCSNNKFGFLCISNYLNNGINSNIFMQQCMNIHTKKAFINNVFYSGCRNITINCDYVWFNIFESNVQFIELTANSEGSATNKLQNIHIHQGVQGTQNAIKTIEVERNATAQINIVATGTTTIEV